MGKITALTAQKRRKNRVNVFLDEAYAFSLEIDAARDLRVGQILTTDDLAALEQSNLFAKARQKSVDLLSYRPRSVWEIQQKLKKDYPEDIIDQVVQYMLDHQLLDDLAFARYWVDQRETFKPKGQMVLGQELRQKGIARELIDEAVADIDEDASAWKAVEGRIMQWESLPREQFRKKVMGYLQRRGFHYGTIREVLQRCEEMLPSNPDEEID